ncbi:hypothetical protein SUGI_0439650 [Cryptomeria japonica]|nr:hypothetical protein SUGI_0439650 [Cryptomeria japonica]
MDSTLSTNKYVYQLYNLLIFDEQEASVPIAWAISSRNKVENLNEWLTEVYKRGKKCKEDWHVNAFITNDASAKIEAISKDVGEKMFDRLGDIMHAMSDNEDNIARLIKEFIEEFKEEKKFIDYFQKTWCHDEGHIALYYASQAENGDEHRSLLLFASTKRQSSVDNSIQCFLDQSAKFLPMRLMEGGRKFLSNLLAVLDQGEIEKDF